MAEQITTARDAVEKLGEFYVLHSEEADIEVLHLLAHDISLAYKDLGKLKAAAESDLLNAMDDDWEHYIDGVGMAKKHRRKSKVRTDGKRLVGVLVARAEAELFTDTGEVPPLDLAMQHTADLIVTCSGIDNPSHNSWRKGVLNEYGVRLDNYQDSQDGGYSVEWT